MPSFCAMWIQSAAVGTVESDAALTTAPAFLRWARGNELLGFSITIKRDADPCVIKPQRRWLSTGEPVSGGRRKTSCVCKGGLMPVLRAVAAHGRIHIQLVLREHRYRLSE